MDKNVTANMLKKHIMKYFKLSPNYFNDDADKEKYALWLSEKLVGEGWFKTAPENTRETLHPLAMSYRYLGGKEDPDRTFEVLPKGSKVIVLTMGEPTL